MTLLEECIVNVAMTAANMLQSGEIEYDELVGHIGMTEDIIAIATKFTQKNEGVDFRDGEHDFWIEIDEFAEDELCKRFAVKQPNAEPAMVNESAPVIVAEVHYGDDTFVPGDKVRLTLTEDCDREIHMPGRKYEGRILDISPDCIWLTDIFGEDRFFKSNLKETGKPYSDYNQFNVNEIALIEHCKK